MGVSDEWAAFQVDLAVLTVGREIENALRNGAKIERLMAPRKSDGGRGFRSMGALVTRSVDMQDGVW